MERRISPRVIFVCPDEIGNASGPNQVDLGFPVPEHMNMCRQMIIDVDDNTQAVSTQHGNHANE